MHHPTPSELYSLDSSKGHAERKPVKGSFKLSENNSCQLCFSFCSPSWWNGNNVYMHKLVYIYIYIYITYLYIIHNSSFKEKKRRIKHEHDDHFKRSVCFCFLPPIPLPSLLPTTRLKGTRGTIIPTGETPRWAGPGVTSGVTGVQGTSVPDGLVPRPGAISLADFDGQLAVSFLGKLWLNKSGFGWVLFPNTT